MSFIGTKGSIVNISTKSTAGTGNSPNEDEIIFDDGAGSILAVHMKTLQFEFSEQGFFMHQKISYDYSVQGESDPQISREYDFLVNYGTSGNPAVAEITPAAKFQQLREAVSSNTALTEKMLEYILFNFQIGFTPAFLPSLAAYTLFTSSDANLSGVFAPLAQASPYLSSSYGWGDFLDCWGESIVAGASKVSTFIGSTALSWLQTTIPPHIKVPLVGVLGASIVVSSEYGCLAGFIGPGKA